MLQVYNSLTRKKQQFIPIEPGKIRIYACGVTVYDYFHIGNARMLVVFDTIVRYLRAAGFDVTYVRNITDIDDKIIARANSNGEDFRVLTERFTAAMHEDTAALGMLPPDIEPKATDSIAEIITMVEALISRGHAYVSNNGDVLYDVSEFPDYGKLANKNLADLRAGSRVEVAAGKDDPLDFVLWKKAKPGEPNWPSPWGDGRPGWHIECSAMAARFLGNHFDIHGGGMDLKFPHHENELAQSEAANGCRFVNYWLHNGFVQIDSEKMSKSLDNFFTVRDVLKQHDPESVRYFLLGSHYRQPLNYSDDSLRNARAALSRLYTALRDAHAPNTPATDAGDSFKQRFHAAMEDDFNTPEAMAVLFDLTREINRLVAADNPQAGPLAATLKDLGSILGFLQDNPDTFLQAQSANARSDGLSATEIDALIDARQAARAAKDFAEADRIRDILTEHRVTLEDGQGGTRWRIE